jgi:hypothetical protein
MLIKGKKNQEFVKFVLVPFKNKPFKYISSLGDWDTRQNKKTRFLILNIYKLLEMYRYGLILKNNKLYNIIYYFLIDHFNQYNFNQKLNLEKIFLEFAIKKKKLINFKLNEI